MINKIKEEINMRNLYEIMENISKEEKMWDCIRVELNDLRKNPDNFGANEVDIISDYFRSDEEFINDNFELYVLSGDIVL